MAEDELEKTILTKKNKQLTRDEADDTFRSEDYLEQAYSRPQTARTPSGGRTSRFNREKDLTADFSRSLSLSPRELRDTSGNPRVRDMLVLDAMRNPRNEDDQKILKNIQGSLDDLARDDARTSSEVATNFLADLLHSTRSHAKLVHNYHQHAVKMLKQPYMHIEGSRYCLSLGVHSHTGPSAKSTMKRMNQDHRLMAEHFKDFEEKLLRFAVDLERELLLEKKQGQELRRSLQMEKLEYARLLEKFENMKNSFQLSISEEKNSIADYKEHMHHERQRERDEWEKERERQRARNLEREREVDRLTARHTAETQSLEREKERHRLEMQREVDESDRLQKEVERLIQQSEKDKGMWERDKRADIDREKERLRVEMENRERDRLAWEKERNTWKDRVASLENERRLDRETFEEERHAWDQHNRHNQQEKASLHQTIVDLRGSSEDTKGKLNTLAADNILLREVMTDLRVNNKRLSVELKDAFSVPPQKRPEWKTYFYKKP